MKRRKKEKGIKRIGRRKNTEGEGGRRRKRRKKEEGIKRIRRRKKKEGEEGRNEGEEKEGRRNKED